VIGMVVLGQPLRAPTKWSKVSSEELGTLQGTSQGAFGLAWLVCGLSVSSSFTRCPSRKRLPKNSTGKAPSLSARTSRPRDSPFRLHHRHPVTYKHTQSGQHTSRRYPRWRLDKLANIHTYTCHYLVNNKCQSNNIHTNS
jgi:hypothetical protein